MINAIALNKRKGQTQMKQIVLSVLGTVLSVIAAIILKNYGHNAMCVIMSLVGFKFLCAALAKKEELDSTRIIYRNIVENYNSIRYIIEDLKSEEIEENDYCLEQSKMNKILVKLKADIYCLDGYFYKYLSRKEKKQLKEIVMYVKKEKGGF